MNILNTEVQIYMSGVGTRTNIIPTFIHHIFNTTWPEGRGGGAQLTVNYK